MYMIRAPKTRHHNIKYSKMGTLKFSFISFQVKNLSASL